MLDMYSITCETCKQPVLEDEYIECSECNLMYDLSCGNLTRMAFFKMSPRQVDRWVCPTCIEEEPLAANNVDNDQPDNDADHQELDMEFHPDYVDPIECLELKEEMLAVQAAMKVNTFYLNLNQFKRKYAEEMAAIEKKKLEEAKKNAAPPENTNAEVINLEEGSDPFNGTDPIGLLDDVDNDDDVDEEDGN